MDGKGEEKGFKGGYRITLEYTGINPIKVTSCLLHRDPINLISIMNETPNLWNIAFT